MTNKLLILLITLLMYTAVIIFQHRKAWIVLGTALLVLLLENVFLPAPFIGETGVGWLEALGNLVNWKVLMIYVGSLALAELFIYSQAPTRLADIIVGACPNSGLAIVLILIITGLISAFVENVATVLVIAPVALALCRKINIKPTYFMVGLAVMSNLQGTATLVGDPPSMIFASFAGYSFTDFFIRDGKLSIFFFIQAGMLVGALYFYLLLARRGGSRIKTGRTPVISVVPTLLFLLMIVGLAACSFIFHDGVTWQAGGWVLFLGVAGLVWYAIAQRKGFGEAWNVVKRLDWETILFLIGIFIVIGALEKTQILADFAALLAGIIGGNVLLGFVVILLVSIVISGFVDNVPYIIVMLPVASSLAAGLRIPPELYEFALLIGSCLGGNLTPFGASANIVAVGILKKEGISLSFPGWLKVGLPFTLFTTAAAAVLVWVVWS